MTTTALTDQRLTELLPLISEAWDDGELTDVEIAAVCMALLRNPDIDLSCREALHEWLDPDDPPTEQDLQALRSRLAADATDARGT